jgi:rod shape-determining protein MreD
MNWPRVILLLLLALLGVFAQATLDLPRRWLGAQPSLLPAVVVSAALNGDMALVALVAVTGGVALDALSENPLGVSVLPLFVIGFVLNRWRDLLLREVTYAQAVLGALAAVGISGAKLLLLLTLGEHPLLGWGSLWQLAVSAAVSAVVTPLVCRGVEHLAALLAYPVERASSFRPDREIKRGRT